MSVHQESISGHVAHAHEEVHVESDINSDMLKMLFTALGGAIIGTLLTLFVLAAINGGTLRYGGGASRLDKVELAYGQLSENVHANTLNMQGQNEQFATDINSINGIVTGHSRSINQMAPMVARTSANSDQTSRLMNALEDVFSQTATTTANDLMVAEDGGEDAAVAGPMMSLAATIHNGTGIPADMVVVLPFVDMDGSGAMEAGEQNEVGITASLIDAAGMAVATVDSGDAGMNFTDIAPGSYELVIENGGPFGSLAGQMLPVEVDASAEYGQLIYLSILDGDNAAAPAAAVAAEGDADADTGDDHAAGDEDAEHADDGDDAAEQAEGDGHGEEEGHDADSDGEEEEADDGH